MGIGKPLHVDITECGTVKAVTNCCDPEDDILIVETDTTDIHDEPLKVWIYLSALKEAGSGNPYEIKEGDRLKWTYRGDRLIKAEVLINKKEHNREKQRLAS